MLSSSSASVEEETPKRLVSVLKNFAHGGTSSKELEFTAELLIATAEEVKNQDRSQLITAFVEVLEETQLLNAPQLPAVAENVVSILLADEDEDSKEEQECVASKRRRLRKERRENQFAVGKSCQVVLEEDDEWHPAIITKHIEDSESDDGSEAIVDLPIILEVEFVEFGKKQIVPEDEVVLDEDVAGREKAEDRTGLCEMCERPMNLTAHHAIPRVTHAKYLRRGYTKEFLNTCIMICRQCHSKIHSVEDNKTLAREYNTLDKIMQHPDIHAWVAYARKQKARIKPRKQNKWPVGK